MKYNETLLGPIYTFFRGLKVRPVDGFSRFIPHTTSPRARVCLLGVSLIFLLIFWGPPKILFGAWIRVFKPDGQNIESFILSNYYVDFSKILYDDTDHQLVIVGGPNMRPTNPRWRTAAILKTVKSPYLCNRITDFDELWHADVYWKLTSGPIVKISNFWKSNVAATAILEITKIEISLQWFDRSLRNLVRWCKICLLTAPTVKNECQKSKTAAGRHFEKR